MAEKIISTRIALKIDTLENWKKSTLGLKKGELAIATIAATEGTGLTEPVTMIKIGEDGTKTFNDLTWNFYAKASDVIAAAKSEDTLRTFITGVIADAGIASSDAMENLADRVTAVEGDIETLNGDASTAGSVAKSIADAIAALDLANTYDAKGAAAQALVDAKAYTDGKDTAMDARVDVLEAAIAADGAVDTKIKNAIDALDVTDTAVAGKYVSAVNEVDGKVVITRADLPDYSETYDAKGAAATALTDAKAYADGLAKNYDASGSAAAVQTKLDEEVARAKAAEAQALTDAKAYADGLASNYDAAGSAAAVQTKLDEEVSRAKAEEAKNATAASNAQTAADKAQGEVDALETLVGTLPEGTDATTVVAYIDAKTANIASDETVGALADRIAAIEGDYLKAEDETALNRAIVAEKERAEGVETGLQSAIDAINNETIGVLAQAKAYADGKDAAIEAAQKAGDDAQADVDALAGKVGEVPADKTVVQMIADAQAAATYDDTQVKADIKTNADAIDAIEADYLKAADKAELEGKIVTNTSAIELLTNGVDAEKVDGVNDLIKYVEEHGAEVTGMKSDISANATAIATEKSRAEGAESALSGRLDTLEAIDIADKAYADQAEANAKTYADGLNTAMNTRVEALEAVDHEHANKALLDTYTQTEADLADAVAKKHEHANAAVLEGVTAEKVAAWDASEQNAKDYADGLNTAMDTRVKAAEGKAHTHENADVLAGIEAADVTAWDAKVDSVTAADGSGLKATRTGNAVAIEIDESVTFVFDCGDAGVTA